MSESIRTHTNARVTVALELRLSQGWGGECSLSQVWKQAKDEALNIVGKIRDRDNVNFRIIGPLHVDAMVIEETRP